MSEDSWTLLCVKTSVDVKLVSYPIASYYKTVVVGTQHLQIAAENVLFICFYFLVIIFKLAPPHSLLN